MRVLHVVHGHPTLSDEAGGTERYVAAVAAAQGADVLARDPRRTDGALQRGPVSGLWSVGVPPPQDFRGTWSCPAADAALGLLLQRLGPDLVHVHHLAHLGFGVAEVCRRAGVPTVISLHDYHLACTRGQLVDRHGERCDGPSESDCSTCVAEHLRAAPGLLALGRVAGAIGIRGAARSAVGALAPGRAERERMAARLAAGRSALDSAARVLSPSRDLGRRLEARGWLGPGEWHQQDLPLVGPVAPAPAPGDGPLRVLFVGHLLPTKGVEVLLEAWKGVPEGQLTLRGPLVPYDGRPRWEQEVEAALAATPRARWEGSFAAKERQAVYDAADVLVVPSTWEENSPLVVREALAAGLRVVASRVGGLPELAPEGRFVPPGDPAALAAALQAESALGRGRAAPRGFALEPHLAALAGHYEAAVMAGLPRVR